MVTSLSKLMPATTVGRQSTSSNLQRYLLKSRERTKLVVLRVQVFSYLLIYSNKEKRRKNLLLHSILKKIKIKSDNDSKTSSSIPPRESPAHLNTPYIYISPLFYSNQKIKFYYYQGTTVEVSFAQ